MVGVVVGGGGVLGFFSCVCQDVDTTMRVSWPLLIIVCHSSASVVLLDPPLTSLWVLHAPSQR